MATNITLTNLRDPFATNAEQYPVLVRLTASGSGMPRTDQSNKVKTSPDGRPTHVVKAKVISADKNGDAQEESNCFVNSIEPLEADVDILGAPKLFKAEGKIWIKPFVSNDRQAYSITVEKLVAVQQNTPQSGGHSDK